MFNHTVCKNFLYLFTQKIYSSSCPFICRSSLITITNRGPHVKDFDIEIYKSKLHLSVQKCCLIDRINLIIKSSTCSKFLKASHSIYIFGTFNHLNILLKGRLFDRFILLLFLIIWWLHLHVLNLFLFFLLRRNCQIYWTQLFGKRE